MKLYKTIQAPSQDLLYETLARISTPISEKGSIKLYAQNLEKGIMDNNTMTTFLSYCELKTILPLGIKFSWRNGLFIPEYDNLINEQLRNIPEFSKPSIKNQLSEIIFNGGQPFCVRVDLCGFRENFNYNDLYDQVLKHARSQGYALREIDIWLKTMQDGPDSGSQAPVEILAFTNNSLDLFSDSSERRAWFDNLEKRCQLEQELSLS